MILYSDATSPLGHCVRIVLAEKDINVEINYIESGERPEELAQMNPYDSVLTLVDRELALFDAQIIMEYLDERFPHPPLMPVDPVSRANNRQLRYRVMRDLYGLVDDIQNDVSVAASRKTLRDHLTAIAPAVGQAPYFMSEEYSLVDCCMGPLLWRLEHCGVKLPTSARILDKYAERLFRRPAFRASLSARERELRVA
jgi:RNA polymerase-associated protein